MQKISSLIVAAVIAGLFSVSASANAGQIDFVDQQLTNTYNSWSAMAEDLDGDGDVDVLGAAIDSDEVAWWENDGQQGFVKHTVASDFEGATHVQAADIDRDGDLDILGTAQFGNQITWFENRPGRPGPRTPQGRHRFGKSGR